MSGLIIDSEACIGCGRCVRACASGGIVVEVSGQTAAPA
ncbi:MAG: 4Fe-4S binding protein [Collinsella sp.]